VNGIPFSFPTSTAAAPHWSTGKKALPFPILSATKKTTPRAQQKRQNRGMRLKDKSGTLCLLVTTQLEVLASLKSELCLGLLLVRRDNLALKLNRTLQAVHSNRSTTFLVVFALCTIVSIIQHMIHHPNIPCGRRAWSDHHNRSAYGHNDAFPVRTAKPCRPCTG
jgi:hypothetical protein